MKEPTKVDFTLEDGALVYKGADPKGSDQYDWGEELSQTLGSKFLVNEWMEWHVNYDEELPHPTWTGLFEFETDGVIDLYGLIHVDEFSVEHYFHFRVISEVLRRQEAKAGYQPLKLSAAAKTVIGLNDSAVKYVTNKKLRKAIIHYVEAEIDDVLEQIERFREDAEKRVVQ